MGDLTTAGPMLLLPRECPGTSDSHREETCVSGGMGRWEVVGEVRFSQIKRLRNRAPLGLESTVIEQTSCCLASAGDALRPNAEQDVERKLGWAKGRAMLDLDRQYSLGIPRISLMSLVVFTLQAARISTCVPIIARFVL
jgi:hypothetical protein